MDACGPYGPIYAKPVAKGNGHHNGRANGAGNGTMRSVTVTVNGRTIDLCATAQMTPSELALLAADLRKAGLPAWLVQLLTEANSGYASTARNLSGWQRKLIEDGKATLSQFHNAKRHDREVEAFLKRPGAVARVLTMLDRMTAPTSVPAE